MPFHSTTIFTLAHLLPLSLAHLPQQKTPFKLAILYNNSIADAHPSFLLEEAILFHYSDFHWMVNNSFTPTSHILFTAISTAMLTRTIFMCLLYEDLIWNTWCAYIRKWTFLQWLFIDGIDSVSFVLAICIVLTNTPVSQIRALLTACREPAMDYDTFSKLLNDFKHKDNKFLSMLHIPGLWYFNTPVT